VAGLLQELRKAEASDRGRALAARAAAHTSLDDLAPVVMLLQELRKAGASDQVRALAARAHVPSTTPTTVARLLQELPKISFGDQAEVLMERLLAAGLFNMYCSWRDQAEGFRFGRIVTSGHPAVPWDSQDLD
jgi:hypothetical protein